MYLSLCSFMYLYIYKCEVNFLFLSFFFFHVPIDVDECTQSPSPCSQNCQDTDGSYTCSCRPGFTLDADGVRCSGKMEFSRLFVYLSVCLSIYQFACRSVCLFVFSELSRHRWKLYVFLSTWIHFRR